MTGNSCTNPIPDAVALHRIAYVAAQHAEVPAYWTDQCCMFRETDIADPDFHLKEKAETDLKKMAETDPKIREAIRKSEFSKDVYRIADVMRAAQKMVIIVGRSGKDTLPAEDSTLGLLKQWATRMWTWPELLLSPGGKPITIYTRGTTETTPIEISSKLNFVGQVFEDADVATRRRLDGFGVHFEACHVAVDNGMDRRVDLLQSA